MVLNWTFENQPFIDIWGYYFDIDIDTQFSLNSQTFW